MDFRPEPAPRVALDFANDSAGAGAGFSTQLTALGYRPSAAGAPSAAEGDAEAVYCRDDERGAAFRLAAQATRWLAQYPGMRDVIVAPRQDPDCAGAAAGASPLLLRIHFAAAPAQPAQWINGQWGYEGDCSSRVTITADARGLTKAFQGESETLAISSATSSLIVAGRRRYALSGDTVTVSGDGLPTRLKRCPG